jgi:L-ectoine synthase
MKKIELFDLAGTEREVKGEGFTSYRYLLESDAMGFGVHRTVIPKGGPYRWHYKYHLEACLCISGKGMVWEPGGKKENILPGDMYVLDSHEEHYFEAIENVVLISVFNPPCVGDEIHQKDGSYVRV